MLIPRCLAKQLQTHLSVFSAVALTGPRQSGKSTLLKNMLPNYQYISFDDAELRALFYEDPKGFLTRYDTQVIFDEAQKVPEIFEQIKLKIDQDRQTKGKFVLSGSSQFLMFRKISESLAGRIGLLELLPFNHEEVPQSLREASIFQGGYPEPVTQNYQHNTLWYNAYLQTYLEKDVRDLLKVNNLVDFRRFISLLAAQVGCTLSMSQIANDLGVSSQTIKNWLSVLEASYIIFLLPPYYNNLGKRIIKSPKLYFWDTGLVSNLTKITSQELYDNGPMAGQIFENYVVSEIAKQQKLTDQPADLYYFRSSHGTEIDLIVDKGQSQDFIEIKKSHSFKPNMLKHLKSLMHDSTGQSYLLYQGESLPEGGDTRIWHFSDYFLKRD